MRFAIKQNTPLTSCVYRMVLQGDTSAITAPGQFVQVQVPGFYLRRPISVCDWDSETLTLVYKVVGNGTDAMCRMTPGTELDLLTGLGNGFDISRCGERPLLIGGGVGLPPMVGLCRCLMQAGKHPTVLAGFNTADEVFLREDVEKLGAPFVLATMDGSAGVKGLVTDALPEIDFTDICACGPLPMLKAIMNADDHPAQLSFEERMGCGFGACMGCTVQSQGRLQANLQGRPGAGARGGHLVSSRDLRVTLSGVTLDNPVIPASGTFGFGQEFTPYYDINILGSLSVQGHNGGKPLRQPNAAHCGMPERDAERRRPAESRRGARHRARTARSCGKSSISRLSPTSAASRWRNTFTVLSCSTKEEQVGILEVNISCPNVHGTAA